ncbi:ATP-binding protein [Streptomyces mirabilis]
MSVRKAARGARNIGDLATFIGRLAARGRGRPLGKWAPSWQRAAKQDEGLASGGVFISSLPRAAQEVGVIRARARAALERCTELTSETRDDALLVISELVTNAVIHARPPAVLRLSRGGLGRALRIEVTDGGPSPARGYRSGSLPEEYGRGTGILAALAAGHGVITGPEGVTRWAEIPLSRSRPEAGFSGQDAPAAPHG